MKRLDRTDRLLLTELARSAEGLSPFTLHRKYHLSPELVSRSTIRLERLGAVELEGHTLRLTSKGQQLVARSHLVLLEVEEKTWRKCPDEFTQPQLPINAPYVPRLSGLGKSLRVGSEQQLE